MADKKPLVLTNGSIKEIGAGDTVPISNGGTGATTATAALNALLPSQTGNNTKVLGTDGTNTSWVAVSGANLTELTAGNLTGTIPSAVLGNSTHFIGTTSIALNRASANQALTGILSTTFAGSTSGTTVLIPTAIAGTTTITLPAVTGTVVTTGDSATVTNTMLAGSIANAKLSNSTISGISLGSNLATLTIGTGLSGTSYNGSTAITIAIDSTVATLTGAQTLTNKTIAAGSNTISGITNTHLSGSAAISNANLANSTVTVGSTAISLGSSATTIAGLTSVTSTTFVGALTGASTSAATLTTPRTIGGVSFNGSANIVPQTIQSVNEAADTTCFPLFISASGTQSLQPLNNTAFTFNASTGALGATTLVTGGSGITIGSSVPFSDSAGTLTLQNVDALDATTESTIEAAIDTLANLTSIQGQTVTLTGAFIRSGAHSLTVTTTGTTSLTLPTTGTLISNTVTTLSSLVSIGTITTGTWNATAIGAGFGGTGQTTYAVGDLLQATASTTLSKLAAVATGNVLISRGVTTASSWGKVGLTTHVSGTLPVANGGTNASSASITAFNNITGYTAAGASGTTSTNLVFSTSPTLTDPLLTVGTPGTLSVGYLGIPQNSQSAAYTCVMTDSGKHIYHPSADTTARTFTIPANSSVAYPIGTAITFINDSSAGVITIAITTDTLVLAGAGTTGSRTLAANGNATAVKITSTRWQISGVGLT